MNCKAYREEIDAADAGGALSAAVERHLAACDACRAFRGERAALRHLVGSLASVAAPPDFDFRLRARMRAGGGGPRGGLAARFFKPLPAALAACAAVLALTIAYVRLQAEAPTPSSAAVTAPSGNSTPAATAQGAQEPRAPESASANESERAPVGEPAAVDESVAVNESVETYAPRRTPRARPSAALRVAGRAKGLRADAGGTADFAMFPADVRTRATGASEGVAMSNPPVQLSASRQPMRVVLRNERGASRVVSMRPVSFGSQEFVGRLNNSFSPSSPSKEVVW